jgi:hypothetical protein
MILYIGPGMDGGVMATVLGIFFSFILLIVALVWYPIKKVFGKLRLLFVKNKTKP